MTDEEKAEDYVKCDNCIYYDTNDTRCCFCSKHKHFELKDNLKVELLEKENADLKAQIEKMKKNCLDVMRVQGNNLTDDYMAGMYNGMVVVYNSCFLKGNELEKNYCSKNEYGKWELAE